MSYRDAAPKPEGFDPPRVLPERPRELCSGCGSHGCERQRLLEQTGARDAWVDETTARLMAAIERQTSHAVTMARLTRTVAWVAVAWAMGGLLAEVLR